MPRLNWCSGQNAAACLALASCLVGQLLTGCKPHTPQAKSESSPAAQETPAPGPNRAVTNLSSCLSEMERSQDAAVEKFLALDLTNVKLFSPETPLAYS